jgi:hypothetical protein
MSARQTLSNVLEVARTMPGRVLMFSSSPRSVSGSASLIASRRTRKSPGRQGRRRRRAHRRHPGEPVGVQPTEFVLQVVACRLAPAPHATDKIKPAMQVDDATISGGLMQSIDVLGSSHRSIASSRARARCASLGTRPPKSTPSESISRAKPLLGSSIVRMGIRNPWSLATCRISLK